MSLESRRTLVARPLVAALLTTLAACGDAGTVDISPDALTEFCERRCEFQATCVPDLRPIIGECVRQCRSSFDNPTLFTKDCTTPDLRLPTDRAGPYTIASVVTYQECAIQRGCAADAPDCEETRMLCLDDLTEVERCNREVQRAYLGCQKSYDACIAANRTNCAQRVQQCYQNASVLQQSCQS